MGRKTACIAKIHATSNSSYHSLELLVASIRQRRFRESIPFLAAKIGKLLGLFRGFRALKNASFRFNHVASLFSRELLARTKPRPIDGSGEEKNYSMDGITMNKTVRGALSLGLPILMIGGSSGQLLAQTGVALQPLQPVSNEQGAMLPLPPPVATPKGAITLEKIPTAVPAQTVSAPMNVMPLKRQAQSAPAGQLREGKLKVEDMIRNQIDISALFSKIKIQQSADPVPVASTVRIQRTPGMGEFEWSPRGYCWQSPAFCYSPLYFEQPNLERYGNTSFPVLAPAVSATYFFGQVTLLPFKSLHQPPWSKSCTLGHHRPGDCAPFQRRNPNHVQTTQSPSHAMPATEEMIWSETSVGTGEPVQQAVMHGQVDQASAVTAIPPSVQPVRIKITD